MRTITYLIFLSLFLSCFQGQAQNNDPSPESYVALQLEPQPINMDTMRRMIGYPPKAVKKRIEGKVIVRVKVDETGRYVEHIVISEAPKILTDQVTRVIHLLQFVPGIGEDGDPITCWVTIPFDFKLTPPRKKNSLRR